VNISCIVMADYSNYFQILSPTKIARFIDLEFRFEIRYNLDVFKKLHSIS
jgi:hypothetical protein